MRSDEVLPLWAFTLSGFVARIFGEVIDVNECENVAPHPMGKCCADSASRKLCEPQILRAASVSDRSLWVVSRVSARETPGADASGSLGLSLWAFTLRGFVARIFGEVIDVNECENVAPHPMGKCCADSASRKLCEPQILRAASVSDRSLVLVDRVSARGTPGADASGSRVAARRGCVCGLSP